MFDKGNKPLVSICCTTYNHAKYVRDTIEGFLMQEVDFPIEIIIHDDASTDRTPEIIKEYEQQYPEIIKPIYQEENQYSQGLKPWPEYVFPKVKSKYIALCEGDDYWMDPLKLQKQVDFMEKYQKYSLAVGGYKRINVKTGEEKEIIKTVVNYLDFSYGYSFSKMDLTKGWITKTLTALFRRNAIEDLNYEKLNYFRDVHLFYHILQKGNGFYFAEVLGAYREHPNGIFSSSDKEDRIINSYYIYKEIFESYGDEPVRIKLFESIKKIIAKKNYDYHEIDFLSLAKEGAGLVKTKKESLYLIKAMLKGIKKTIYNSLSL